MLFVVKNLKKSFDRIGLVPVFASRYAISDRILRLLPRARPRAPNAHFIFLKMQYVAMPDFL